VAPAAIVADRAVSSTVHAGDDTRGGPRGCAAAPTSHRTGVAPQRGLRCVDTDAVTTTVPRTPSEPSVQIDQQTADYLAAFADAEDDALRAARAISQQEQVPLVPHVVGALLRWLAGLGPAHDVVEVGGGVGYSALWLLGGMHPRGMLTTIEVDPDRRARAQDLLARSGHGQRVRTILGAALTVLPRLADRSYDLVFVDAVKTEYPAYLDHARRLLRPGGLLVADNMFMQGRAPDPEVRDEAVDAVRAFAATVRDDPALDALLLPVGDGVLVARMRAAAG
jgi:predicted O-methyltransferase YrrM